jgi:hypothetical protein
MAVWLKQEWPQPGEGAENRVSMRHNAGGASTSWPTAGPGPGLFQRQLRRPVETLVVTRNSRSAPAPVAGMQGGPTPAARISATRRRRRASK